MIRVIITAPGGFTDDAHRFVWYPVADFEDPADPMTQCPPVMLFKLLRAYRKIPIAIYRIFLFSF